MRQRWDPRAGNVPLYGGGRDHLNEGGGYDIALGDVGRDVLEGGEDFNRL